MKLNTKLVAGVLIVVMFGGIWIAKGLNVWRTDSSKIPAKYTTGTFAGEYNPDDIRGSYTLNDVSKSFGIPVEDIAQAFAIKVQNPAEFKVKDLGTLYTAANEQGKAMETTSMRYFIALYKGYPYSISVEPYLPKPAVELLKTRGTLPAEQLKYLESHTVEAAGSEAQSNSPANAFSPSNPGTVKESSESATERIIKGNTTFKEVLDWGVPRVTVEKIINGKIPATGLAVRDYSTQKGMEFSTVKTALQAEIDKLP